MEMMGSMMSGMSKEEKEQMMDKMMEKFFEGMTAGDKQKMMEQMMPKMMMDMMSGGKKTEMSEMPHMMPEMMPYCLGMVLPSMPTEERVGFVLKMVTSLMEQGCAGMSNEEKADFVAKIIEQVKTWNTH